MKEKLLLYVCCGPCAVYPADILSKRFNVTMFFYAPNIHPEEEYNRRLEAVIKVSRVSGIPLIVSEYGTEEWFSAVRGLENEPEGGRRCVECYRIRMDAAGRFAKENGYRYFSAVLSVSPHKKVCVINPAGESAGLRYGVEFLGEDYKKKGGFEKSCRMSREYGLYRQKYCGCRFSIPAPKPARQPVKGG